MESSDEADDGSVSNNIFEELHQYFITRVQYELQMRQAEEAEFNEALLLSRDEFDANDTVEKNEEVVVTKEHQKYSTIKIKEKRKQICCICMDKFSCNQQVYWLDCKHIYHKDCLDNWICYKQECPICRCKITTDCKT